MENIGICAFENMQKLGIFDFFNLIVRFYLREQPSLVSFGQAPQSLSYHIVRATGRG